MDCRRSVEFSWFGSHFARSTFLVESRFKSSFIQGAIPLAEARQDQPVHLSLSEVSAKKRQLTFPEVSKRGTSETVSLPGIPQKRHIDACPL